MMDLITEHIDVWTSAQFQKKNGGRGRSKGANDQSIYGIKKLRELILELAVRGKLVPQDPNDEPASVLLEKIEKEKARLIKERRIKRPKKLSEVSEEEKHFEMPLGWEVCRLGTLINSIISGGTPSKRNPEYWNGDIPWASVKDLGTEKYLKRTQDTITEKGLKTGSKLAGVNDVIICTRMGLGKIAISKIKVAINQDLKAVKLTSNLDVNFFLLFFSTLKIKGTGTTVAGIRQDQLLNYVITLPPLAEQHRIVAKVDELMILCDKLEQQQTDSNATHQALVETLLSVLTNAADQTEFNDTWQRIADHFDCLFTTEQSIDHLKQTILQLAIMGKLVPQDPNDEPASVLLEKIAAEKTKLIKQGKIKKQKKLPEISAGEKPFEIPDGWEWVRVWDVALLITSGSRGWAKYYSDQGAVFVTMGNLSRGSYQLRLDNLRYVAPPVKGEGSRTKLQAKDLLISITGDVGNLGLIPDNFGEAYINQHTCLLRFMPDCRNRYFPELMRSPLAACQFNAPQRGLKNSFRLGDLGLMIIPLPPLSEQYLIVAKVDELMAICDKLQARMVEAQANQLQLANAIVAKAVNH